MMKRFDIVGVAPYAIILLVSAFLYYQAMQIPSGDGDRLAADIWPKTILFFAILTCVWEIVRKIWISTHVHSDNRDTQRLSLVPEKPVEEASEVGKFVPWVGIALTAAYVFSFPWLGYFLATSLYVTAFVYFGNYRRLFAAACVGVASSLAFMFLFMRVVYVSLPIGVEPFAYVSTFLMRAMGIK
jgi:putative tricarboxylic transport membrane protein